MGLWEAIGFASIVFAQKSPVFRSFLGNPGSPCFPGCKKQNPTIQTKNPFLDAPLKNGQTDRSVNQGSAPENAPPGLWDCGTEIPVFSKKPCFSVLFHTLRSPKIE